MNPWAFLVILLGIVLVIIGVKGTQHNITSAITGKQHAGSTVNVIPAAGNTGNTTGLPLAGEGGGVPIGLPHQPNTPAPGTPSPTPNPSPS